jgi:D-sedoheptulose 7-phosphate isomerase
MYKVAILAGGLATRLRPLTETIPKSLVEVSGKPFILHQIDYLNKQGVTDIVLCVGYLGEMIQEVVGNGKSFGVNIKFSYDGENLLGTGGAIKNALPFLSDNFFILYGDSYLPINYSKIQQAFIKSNKMGLMTIFKNKDKWDKSNVHFENDILIEYNKINAHSKMDYIDYGLGILSKSVFDKYSNDMVFDLADVYQELSKKGQLEGLEVFDRFYEIGSHIGLEQIQKYLKTNQINMNYSVKHLNESVEIIQKLDSSEIEKMADLLVSVKTEGGRIFFLGVGGSAGNCSHAVNDFRKIVGIESYAPTDNVSELTARTNDEGWATIFVEWLKISKLNANDILFILSVGGGNLEKNISPNLVEAIKFAKSIGAKVTGIVGRDGGYTAQMSDACVIVPTVNPDNITPHSEAFQAVIWHLLVSHPKLKVNQTKWESTVKYGIY